MEETTNEKELLSIRIQLNSLKKSYESSLKEKENIEKKANRLNFEAEKLQKLLSGYQKGENPGNSLLENERNILKEQLTCEVCNDRNKSCCITRCGHLFCSPCVKKNLKDRSRKCPGCSKAFGEADVVNIFFN